MNVHHDPIKDVCREVRHKHIEFLPCVLDMCWWRVSMLLTLTFLTTCCTTCKPCITDVCFLMRSDMRSWGEVPDSIMDLCHAKQVDHLFNAFENAFLGDVIDLLNVGNALPGKSP